MKTRKTYIVTARKLVPGVSWSHLDVRWQSFCCSPLLYTWHNSTLTNTGTSTTYGLIYRRNQRCMLSSSYKETKELCLSGAHTFASSFGRSLVGQFWGHRDFIGVSSFILDGLSETAARHWLYRSVVCICTGFPQDTFPYGSLYGATFWISADSTGTSEPLWSGAAQHRALFCFSHRPARGAREPGRGTQQDSCPGPPKGHSRPNAQQENL